MHDEYTIVADGMQGASIVHRSLILLTVPEAFYLDRRKSRHQPFKVQWFPDTMATMYPVIPSPNASGQPTDATTQLDSNIATFIAGT
jgi:hypothetical protein